MEQVAGKKRGAFSHWWCNDGSADATRYWLVVLTLFALCNFGYLHHMNTLLGAHSNYEAPSPILYAPTHVTSGVMDTKDLAVVRITNKAVFAQLDINSALHFSKQEKINSDDLLITHIIKPTNESTHAYMYEEILKARVVSFWLKIVPKAVSYRDSRAMVKCDYEHAAARVSFLLSALFSFILSFIISVFWGKQIKKKRIADLHPK